jgi:hypothetical protein
MFEMKPVVLKFDLILGPLVELAMTELVNCAGVRSCRISKDRMVKGVLQGH